MVFLLFVNESNADVCLFLQDRSSFRTEMEGVAKVLAARRPLLCALDELGRSTAPDDGAALCAALIRALQRDESVVALVSTHFRFHQQLLGPQVFF